MSQRRGGSRLTCQIKDKYEAAVGRGVGIRTKIRRLAQRRHPPAYPNKQCLIYEGGAFNPKACLLVQEHQEKQK